MDAAAARQIFDSASQTAAAELRSEMYAKAIRYAEIRARYCLEDAGGRASLEESRSRAHDSFIDACNILSRSMGSNGEDNSWRRTLGDDRRVIGDFACYVALFLGLKAR